MFLKVIISYGILNVLIALLFVISHRNALFFMPAVIFVLPLLAYHKKLFSLHNGISFKRFFYFSSSIRRLAVFDLVTWTIAMKWFSFRPGQLLMCFVHRLDLKVKNLYFWECQKIFAVPIAFQIQRDLEQFSGNNAFEQIFLWAADIMTIQSGEGYKVVEGPKVEL